MRIQAEPAFILHSQFFRDSQCLVDFITQSQGKVRGIMYRRRASTAKPGRAVAPQPFCPLSISYTQTRELARVQRVELSGGLYLLRGKKLMSALYINELLFRLLPYHDASSMDIYTLYINSLDALSRSDNIEIVLRLFEKHLLVSLGYALPMHEESNVSQLILPEAFYRFIPNHGFLRDSAAAPDALSGAHLLALYHEALDDPAVLKTAKRLMRQIMQHLLGGKPLKSRELWG